MDINAIVQIITNVGFPIAMCGVLGYYVKYTHDDHRKDLQTMNETHDKEVSQLTTAINNNTIVIQKLVDKMDENN